MIRITSGHQSGRRIFRIEGVLTAEDLPAFDQMCRELENSDSIDLSGLQSADSEGSERLRELAKTGVEIRGASPYVSLLLSNGGQGH